MGDICLFHVKKKTLLHFLDQENFLTIDVFWLIIYCFICCINRMLNCYYNLYFKAIPVYCLFLSFSHSVNPNSELSFPYWLCLPWLLLDVSLCKHVTENIEELCLVITSKKKKKNQKITDTHMPRHGHACFE